MTELDIGAIAARYAGNVEFLVYPPDDGDIRELAARMRPADAAEVRAATGVDDLEAIVRDSVDLSREVWAVRLGREMELAAIWGVADGHDGILTGRLGFGWLLTTGAAERRRRVFWELSKFLAEDLLSRWDHLVNAVDVRHEQALRWARRLGFTVDAPAPFGALGMPFCRIHRSAAVVPPYRAIRLPGCRRSFHPREVRHV